MDKRMIKTKKILKDSLINLMLEKNFDKITVKDLTERADINRATFYLHYNDKYDLLEQCENELLDELNLLKNNIFKSNISKGLPPTNTELFNVEITNIYTFVKDNKTFLKILLGPNGDLYFQIKVKKYIEDFIKENMSINFKVSDYKADYLLSIATSIQFTIIQKWLENDMKETPEQLSTLISNIALGIYTMIN